MQSVQGDTLSQLVLDFQTVIQQLVPQTDKGKDIQNRLLEFDGNVTVGSKLATYFHRWYIKLQTLPSGETNQSNWENSVYLLNVFTGAIQDPNCDWNPFDRGNSSTCLGLASAYFDDMANGGHATWGDECHNAVFEHQILGGTILKCIANR